MDDKKYNLIGVVMTDIFEKFGPRIVVAGVCNVEIATSFSNEHGYEYEKLKNFYSNSIPMLRCDCEEFYSAYKYISDYLGFDKTGEPDKFSYFDPRGITTISHDKGYVATLVGPQKIPDVIEERFNRQSLGIHYMYKTLSDLSALLTTTEPVKSSIVIKRLNLLNTVGFGNSIVHPDTTPCDWDYSIPGVNQTSDNNGRFLSEMASYGTNYGWDYSMYRARHELSIVNILTLDFDVRFDEVFVQYLIALHLAIKWKRIMIDNIFLRLTDDLDIESTYITLEELFFSAGDSLLEYLHKAESSLLKGEMK